MSLLSHIIIPTLEKELNALDPEIEAFIVKQLHSLATDVFTWASEKMQSSKEKES
jgi:hypothetical protein